jgi:hypothetical protein
VTALPASVSYPVALRIGPAGTPYYSELILVATDTLRPYRVTLAGTPPAFVITAIPTVADIRADFATVAALKANVPTVAALRSWGF